MVSIVEKLKKQVREINILLTTFPDNTYKNVLIQKMEYITTQSISQINILTLENQFIKSKKYKNNLHQNKTQRKQLSALKHSYQLQKQQIRNYQYNIKEIKSRKNYKQTHIKSSCLHKSLKQLTTTQQIQCDINYSNQILQLQKVKKQNQQIKKTIQSLQVQYSQKLNELESYKELIYRIYQDKKIGQFQPGQSIIQQNHSQTNTVQDKYQSQTQSITNQDDNLIQTIKIIPYGNKNKQIEEDGALIWGTLKTIFYYFSKSKN